MKTFLFRLSRLASVISFLILFVIFVSFIYKAITLVGVLILSLVFLLPLLIFNWVCFGKISIWINK